MSTPASALPSVMQTKMAQLRGVEPPVTPPVDVTPPVTPPVDATPPVTPPVDTNTGERITVSREEYNELQAQAGRANTLASREEIARLELEDARGRLTELENSNKSVPTPSVPAAPSSAPAAIDTTGITFTDEENEQYGESRAFLEKVVDLRVASVLNKLLPTLTASIEEVKQSATRAATSVEDNNARAFHTTVTAAVPDIGELIKHKHWAAFLDEIEGFSGATFDQVLTHNVSKKQLAPLVKIYDTFREKYVKSAESNGGFAGAVPGGGAVQLPPDKGQVVKLKVSDRKKASEDYRKGSISYEQLQVISKKFQEADALGNVDHNS